MRKEAENPLYEKGFDNACQEMWLLIHKPPVWWNTYSKHGHAWDQDQWRAAIARGEKYCDGDYYEAVTASGIVNSLGKRGNVFDRQGLHTQADVVDEIIQSIGEKIYE